jgi:hypothetical protein
MPQTATINLNAMPRMRVTDFQQLLAEVLIGLAHQLGQGDQIAVQKLTRAAFERQHALDAGLEHKP